MGFQVFIDGARDSSPDGVRRLADAIAERYGLPLDSLLKRLGSGRFRVKKGVDQATADAFAADLHKLGARCSVVDEATGQPVAAGAARSAPQAVRAPAIPSGALRSAPPAVRAPSVVGAGTPRPEPAPAPETARASDDTADEYHSGLSAAFSGRSDSQELGALGQFSPELTPTDAFRLSSIDGQEEAAPAVAQSAPAAEPSAASAAPAPAPEPAGPAVDPFAPPDAATEDYALELAVAQAPAAPVAPPAAAPPPAASASAAFAPPDASSAEMGFEPGAAAQPEPGAASLSAPSAPPSPDASGREGRGAAPPRPGARELLRKHIARSPQVRGIVGVVLVALLAFAPARLYWGSKVEGAQAALNVVMAEEYQTARRDPRAWDGLRQYGQEQLSFQRTRLSGSRVTAILIMLLVGAGLGFAWFRKVPWHRV